MSTFAISIPVSSVTGNTPDIALMLSFVSVLATVFILMIAPVTFIKIVHMIRVEKPESPIRAAISWIAHESAREHRAENFTNMFIAFCFFVFGFATLKGAIAVLQPFAWDQTFIAWDRAIHFGRLPHEWLDVLVKEPNVVWLFNLFYNLWYFILVLCVLIAGIFASNNSNHLRFLSSIIFTWLVAGFFFATFFSSAGPCFYERAGFGDDYVSLMQSLRSAAEQIDIWALPVQDLLWEGFIGTRPGSAGISAFPSVHVATAVLIALYASSHRRWLGYLGWVYAAIIMVGSVVLAWHYAVDGYAGGLIALAVWKTQPYLPLAKLGFAEDSTD